MKKKDYTQALLLLQSFETSWTFCYLSEGGLYVSECQDIAHKLAGKLREINTYDTKIFNSKKLRLNDVDSTEIVEEMINKLDDWKESNREWPYDSLAEMQEEVSRIFTVLKKYLLSRVDKELDLPDVWLSGNTGFSDSRIRWDTHLPRHMLGDISDYLEDEISRSRTIVVVGDIRKSQDLMTYSLSADYFRDRMIEFSQQSRTLIKKNFGIFDKFTGDGFLAYFNDYVCNQAGQDFIACFLDFAREIMEFSSDHFSRWTKSIRKLPIGSSGLTLGADIGQIEYKEIEGHLLAIGDTIVWANRMCSAGKSNEVVLNNILYNLVRHYYQETEFETREAATNAGESFMAYIMKRKAEG